MTAKEYLQQIKKIDAIIKNKSFEIKQAEEIGADASFIKNEREQLQQTKQSIIADIQKLPEAEYDVLHKIYVQGETLYEVASDRKTSYSLAASIHGRALKMLESIMKNGKK